MAEWVQLVLKYVQYVRIELQDPFSVEREDPCGDFCPNPFSILGMQFMKNQIPQNKDLNFFFLFVKHNSWSSEILKLVVFFFFKHMSQIEDLRTVHLNSVY